MHRVVRAMGLLRSLRSGFSQVTTSSSRPLARREQLQFSKHRLVDFGELPQGEIPDALKFIRPTQVTRLPNGVRVGAETWVGGQPAITVLVKAGSRQEHLENSSAASFAAHGALLGTGKYSKQKIEELVDSIGGHIGVKVSRELTEYTLAFQPQFLSQAVELLAEVVLNPTYDPVQIEALKPTIHKSASSLDPYVVSTESIHYTSYRDHFLGQPSTGLKDVVHSITPEQVRQYHHNFYVGKNIVVSAAGNLDATAFTTEVGNRFGSITTSQVNEVPNSERPLYTPSLLFQRDDEFLNTAFSVAFEAPSWQDPDFFAINFFKRIIGEWRCDKYTGEHLNSAHLQYNSFHTYLGNFPDLILHKPFYFAYSDTGLFGNFIYGNEIFTAEMSTITQNKMSTYAQYVNQSEVFRARNKYWNDLLQFNDPAQVALANSEQLAYLDRLIPRTEIATRISHMNPDYVTKVATKWFWDKETTITAWGNLHSIMSTAHYNRTFRRATLGQYSQVAIYAQY